MQIYFVIRQCRAGGTGITESLHTLSLHTGVATDLTHGRKSRSMVLLARLAILLCSYSYTSYLLIFRLISWMKMQNVPHVEIQGSQSSSALSRSFPS